MTSSDGDIVKRLAAAFGSGDMEDFLDLLDPEVVLRDLDPPPGKPDVVRGREAVARVMQKYVQELSGTVAEVEEYLDVGDEAIVCVTRRRSREAWAELHTVRNGLLVRSVMGFKDRDAALAAARRSSD